MIDALRTLRDLPSNAGRAFKRRVKRRHLIDLATIHHCSKWDPHWYAQHYQTHFFPLRKKKLKILEIGVGGYEDPESGGNSLRMWQDFFPNSRIYGVDVYAKTIPLGNRSKVFTGDQRDETFLHALVDEIGGVDIVIDDASHINDHTIKTFEVLFPRLSDGGVYVIEDLNNSYWPSHGGDSHDLNNPATIMNVLKCRIDGLNHKELLIPHHLPDYYDTHVIGLHFYHNLVFIDKGHNNEIGIKQLCSSDWAAMNKETVVGYTGIGAGVGGEVVQKRRDSLDLTRDAMMVRNQDGTIRFWNTGSHQLYGWPSQEALGESSHRLLKTIFPEPLKNIEGELR